MCPSYLATGEEKHSTRGRAHLLHEMTRGEVIADGWDSEAVEDALSLCLACKGCKADCPVGVDVATWKAEFRAHHYQARRRPRSAYCDGADRSGGAARVACAPALANAIATSPPAQVGWPELIRAQIRRNSRRGRSALGSASAATGRTRYTRAALARHVQRQFPPADAGRRDPAARARGIQGRNSARASVLRAAAL